MKFEFKDATKKQSKLRCTIYGPSGAGKTFTSLSIATGIIDSMGGGTIAVIDTENGRARKHSKNFKFKVVELTDYKVSSYIEIINLAAKNKFDVLIIDSLSHAWKEVLQEVNRLSSSKYRDNSFRAWGEGTPLYNKLFDAILAYNGHIICSSRSKTEWLIEVNEKGKSAPKRIGTAPVQRSEYEYEFDFVIEIEPTHNMTIIKGYDDFQDKVIIAKTNNIQDRMSTGIELGKEFIQWLDDGEKEILATSTQIEMLEILFEEFNISQEKIKKGLETLGCNALREMKHADIEKWINSLNSRKSTIQPQQPEQQER